ncbi:hypothetical protein OR233_004438 [Enterobacter asburiae]|nr:hypothetical protein [Enterobacter asburiae]
MKFTKILILAAVCFQANAANMSDTTEQSVTFEVKKPPVPLSLVIQPVELTEKRYENGTLIANAILSAKDGSAHKLALRFSPTNQTSQTQVTEASGTRTELIGENSKRTLPLYIDSNMLLDANVNDVQMLYTPNNVASYTFRVVLAGNHIIYADTYTLKMEGAIYNP